MKKLPLLLSAALAAGTAGMPLAAYAQTVNPRPPAAPEATAPEAVAPADQSNNPIEAIEKATDPSTAINAYAQAMAAHPNSLAAEKAYMRRMVSFALPEMAEAQAKDITHRDPNDGLAWAVDAYIAAKRHDTPAALPEIVAAVQHAPDDPFVLRTAGQIMAWYDVHADKSQIPQPLQQSIAAMRKDLKQRQTYLDAYSDAYKVLTENAAEDQGTASENQPPPSEQVPQGYYPDMTASAYGPSYYGTTWTDPYAYAYAPGYAYGYPSYYWYPSYAYYPGSWWWPSFGLSFGYFGGHYDHDHHHHDDYDHHGHGEYNHGHGQFAHGHGESGHDKAYGGHYNGHRGFVGGNHAVTGGFTGHHVATARHGTAFGHTTVRAPSHAYVGSGHTFAGASPSFHSAPMRGFAGGHSAFGGARVGGFAGHSSGFGGAHAGGFAGHAGGFGGHAGGFGGGHGGFGGGHGGFGGGGHGGGGHR